MNSYLTKQIYTQLVNSAEIMTSYIKTLTYTSHMAIQYHTRKILGMCNLIPKEYFENQIEQQKKSDGKPNQKLPQEMCYDKMNIIIKNLKECHKILDINNLTQEKKDEYFKLPVQRASNGLSTKIYSKLQLKDNTFDQQTNSFGNGGFAEIYKAKIQYSVQQPNGCTDYIPKTVAIKEEKNSQDEENRSSHEKKILTLLENEECPYISKFYYSEQQPDKLIMEFYPNKSFDHFKSNFSLTMTLSTKIYMLWQVASGIRFLNQKGIIHLDLKPANILISRNYIAKITDFGESYSKQVCDNNFKPGRTIPYCPPEVLQDVPKNKYNDKNSNFYVDQSLYTSQYNLKTDIYSLGVIISDIIFDSYPIEMKKGSQKQIQNIYKENRYFYNILNKNKQYAGPKDLMELILLLISKCLEEPEERAYIERVIIIIREALTYIERMY